MRVAALIIGFSLASTAQAQAEGFQNCTARELAVIAQSLDHAKALTLSAAASVGDTREYERWFGDYSDANAEKVRASLKGIVSAIRRGMVTGQCDQVEPNGCASGEYAFVYSDTPYHLHLCPTFFDLPSLDSLRLGTRQGEFGTREGTIIHEMSHFVHVAGTSDHCYSRTDCAQMAREDATLAIDNADSYQYFAEDVTIYARQSVANKPPPAPRPDR